MRFLTDTNKAGQRFDEGIEYLEEARGKALAMWTYASEELLELEYREVFLKTWQFAGHVSELAEPGAYIVFDLWRDSVIIMRGKDGVLRAFQNVCRHRASRLVDGKGQCKGVIQCQYHGWTFNLDGSLRKTQKSTLLSWLEKDTSMQDLPTSEQPTLAVVDMMVVLRMVCTDTSRISTFGDLSDYLLALILKMKCKYTDIVGDHYMSISIKSGERSHRGSVQVYAGNQKSNEAYTITKGETENVVQCQKQGKYRRLSDE